MDFFDPLILQNCQNQLLRQRVKIASVSADVYELRLNVIDTPTILRVDWIGISNPMYRTKNYCFIWINCRDRVIVFCG